VAAPKICFFCVKIINIVTDW